MVKKLLVVLSYVLVAAIAAVLTYTVVITSMFNGYSKLDQLESYILNLFIEDVDRDAIEDAAANAMVGALGDRWSYYLTADEYAAQQEQLNNSYVGVGITVSMKQDGTGVDVLQVSVNGPAEAAGIMAGDVIVAVEGQSVAGKTLDEISTLIKGEAQTRVEMTLQRGDEEYTVSVERRKINTPVAVGKLLTDEIGLITIENFDSRCHSETVAAIEDLRVQGAKKLIFDVRNNPGGYKEELVKLLDYLLPEGVLFRSEYYNGKTDEDHSDARFLDMPMAVLVNGNSYSAAEFFAVALQEYEKGIVVGTQTCGKGYFQQTFPLKDGSAVGLSVGKYFTPKGVSLAGVGITPDVIEEVDAKTEQAIYYDTLDPMEDPQILAAIEALNAQ